MAVAVFVVSGGDDVGHNVVEARERPRCRFPHFARGLVEHVAVADYVVVLLNDVACAEHGLDVQVVDIVGDPCGLQLEKGLVNVVFRVALRVAEQNHRKRIGVVKMLLVGAMLGRHHC